MDLFSAKEYPQRPEVWLGEDYHGGTENEMYYIHSGKLA